MRKITALAALGLVILLATGALAAAIEFVVSRAGDNTIYFTWDAEHRRITEASSSRRFTADQQVELLTRLTDRTGAVVARGVLKNVSTTQHYRVRGRLVQRIYSGSEVFRVRRSTTIHRVLAPGEKARASFRYRIPSGSYSVRTDFVQK
ncbi:MAG TPA: hypothetical protein VG929_10035 [Actinomycetota bacterium]|nr:hypothetical protein [Actinomycetota bacterium]